MKICIQIYFLFYLCTSASYGQNSVGVTKFTSETIGGYTFFSPFSGTKAYLIDICGRLVNEWDRGSRPGLSAYLLENGIMLRTYKTIPKGPFTSASNAGGLELVDWDNQTIWQYEINTSEQISHHDAVYMPTGHILVLTWKLVYTDEIIALGRDPAQIAEEGFMWSENILELKPIGKDAAEIVWEWNIKDHYIQDFDTSKNNFGVIGEHPELFDLNFPELTSPNSNATRDWNHFNSIDYHPTLDQILVSTRNSDEIWILDHSTSTEEATGHSGGKYGRGGDILYRWGNANAYRQSPEGQQKLFGQHGAQWIKPGLENENEIIIFNNGNGRLLNEMSTIEILQPIQAVDGSYPLSPNAPIGPENTVTIYGDEEAKKFYAPFLSNAQRLDGGHTLINAGTLGRIFEIDGAGEILWDYTIPLNRDLPISQGMPVSNNWTFRAYRYSDEFPGFSDIEIIPKEPLELNPDLSFCITTQTSEESNEKDEYVIYRLEDRFLIEKSSQDTWQVRLFNAQGQLISIESLTDVIELNIPHSGIFFAHLMSIDIIKGQHKLVLP